MKSSVLPMKSDATSSNQDLFRTYSERIRNFGKSIGVEIVPYRSPDLPYFSAQAPERQEWILKDLETHVRVCEMTTGGGAGVDDSVSMIWYAIKRLGLRPPSDLFNYIHNESIIEIHDCSGIQIFRNFDFYSYCSYSIEELHCFPWNILFKRDTPIMEELMGILQRMHRNEIKGVYPLHNYPEYLIEEAYSPFRLKIAAKHHYFAPLYDDRGACVATMVIEDGRLEDPPNDKESDRMLREFYSNRPLDNFV